MSVAILLTLNVLFPNECFKCINGNLKSILLIVYQRPPNDIFFKKLLNHIEQQKYWFWTLEFRKKGVHFFQATLFVFPFLASLEKKKNKFCEYWNTEQNLIIYHILQITIEWKIASLQVQFRNN